MSLKISDNISLVLVNCLKNTFRCSFLSWAHTDQVIPLW